MITSWIKDKVADRLRSSFSIGALVEQFSVHVRALSQLFLAECKEYVKHQLTRVILIVVGIVFLALAYVAFWVTAVLLIATWLPLLYSAAICFGFHLLVGLILVLAASMMKGKPFAEATRRELQNDITCARLTLNKKKS